MMNGSPFARARMLAAAIAAVFSTMPPGTQRHAALAALPVYESHGKGGKRPHRVGNGAARVKRAALKRRNIIVNRRNHRG